MDEQEASKSQETRGAASQWLIRERLAIAFLFLIVLIGGAVGVRWSGLEEHSGEFETWAEAFYRSLQLFGLNFESGGFQTADEPAGTGSSVEYNWLLITARFLAPFVTFFAIISLFFRSAFDEVKKWRRLLNFNHIVLVGFGPTGQAVAKRLCQTRKDANNALLVILTRTATADAVRLANKLNAVILYGDPSSHFLLKSAVNHSTPFVYVAMDDDLATLDAVEAVQWRLRDLKEKLKKPIMTTFKFGERPIVKTSVRAFFSDMDVVHNLADADASGFWLQEKTRCFSIKWETAKQLIRDARFDRAALARGQDRLHLAIVGTGVQAEAILAESLNSCLRIDLKPPKITVIGQGADALKERLRRRAPGFFLDPAQGGLYVGARPELAFFECDPETLNFAEQDALRGDATAWVVCTPDENINLRVAIALQAAMRRKNLRGAQVYLRVWGGVGGEVHEIASRSIGMIRPFGALGTLLDRGDYFDQGLDGGAIDLHRRYQAAGRILADAKLIDGFAEPDWQDLAESLRASNRRLARHGPMKLEDLGFHWRGLSGIGLLSADDRKTFTSQLPKLSQTPDDVSEPISKRFLRTVIQEHDRWSIDRVIDGWLSGTTRNDSRRIHPAMIHWSNVDLGTRAYDSILVRALLLDQPASSQSNRKHRVNKADLPMAFLISTGIVSVATDGNLIASEIEALPDNVTELTMLFHEKNPARPSKTEISKEASYLTLAGARKLFAERQRLCVVRLVFQEPPSPPVFDLAAIIADVALAQGLRVETDWAWEAQPFPPAIGASSAP